MAIVEMSAQRIAATTAWHRRNIENALKAVESFSALDGRCQRRTALEGSDAGTPPAGSCSLDAGSIRPMTSGGAGKGRIRNAPRSASKLLAAIVRLFGAVGIKSSYCS